MSGESESVFRHLPAEILDYIFKFLWDKYTTRLVCRRWRYILDHPSLRTYNFRPIIRNNAEVKNLFNTCLEIDSIQIRYLKNAIPSMTYSRNKFPSTKTGILGLDNSGSDIIKFLQYGCEVMECLRIGHSSLKNINIYEISHVLPEIKWNFLQELDLTITWNLDKMKQVLKHIGAMECFLKYATASKLKKLSIRLENEIIKLEYIIPIQKLMSEFYSFLSRHTDTLKSLEMVLKVRVFQVNITTFKVPDEIKIFILQNLKLEEFELWFNQHQIIDMVLPCLLESQTKLSSLTWISGDPNENPLQIINSNIIQHLIQRNEKTLQSLRVINSLNINIEWFKNCKSLTYLSGGPSGIDLNEIDIPLPNLTHLEIVPRDYLPQQFDSWIIRNFKNVQTIIIHSGIRNLQLYELQNLLTLPNIREIYHWSFQRNNDNFNQIRSYCLKTNGLSHNYTKGYFYLVYGGNVIVNGWVVFKAKKQTETNQKQIIICPTNHG